MSSTMNPVGSVESMEREIPMLYLYRREADRLRRPRRVARRRLPRLGDGRPPLARALHLHRRPRPERHARASACSAAGPRPAARCGAREDCAIRDWLDRRARCPARRSSCARWRPAAASRRRRCSTTGCIECDVFEVLPEPGRRLRRPDAARARARRRRRRARAGRRREHARAIYGVVLDARRRAGDAATRSRAEALRAPAPRAQAAARAARGRRRRADRAARPRAGDGRPSAPTAAAGALGCAPCGQRAGAARRATTASARAAGARR